MWLCKNCGAEVNDNFDICQNCGTDWLGKPPDEKTKDSYPNKKYKIPASKNDGNEKEFGNNKSEFGKYPALKTIAGFIAILGILVIIVGIAGLIIFIKAANPFLGFGVLISCLVVALPLMAFSDLVQIFIDIEKNTRRTRELTEKRHSEK